MSQKKVDEYKKYKRNRREIIKKEKRKNRLIMAGIWVFVVIFIACVGASIGVTFYNNYQTKLASLPTYGSTSFILSDIVGIQSEQEEAEDASEEAGSVEEASVEAQSEEVESTDASETESTEMAESETAVD